MTSYACRVVGSAVHHYVKTAVSVIAPSELARKKVVSRFFRCKATIKNIVRNPPSFSFEELISWRRVMGLKIHYAREVYRGNAFYGAGFAMRSYAGFPNPIKACIEHGVYFGNYVNPLELDDSGLPAVITFGTERSRRIHSKSNLPILAVGPYIAYSSNYCSETELNRAKNQLGRILLAFPSHSVAFADSRFDTSEYIRFLIEKKDEFDIDTVLISLYFSDILTGCFKEYEQAGFTVVTCGYSEDARFLMRLRSLIELADLTSSNAIGTHIGYCVYLNKPHIMYIQEHETVGITQADSQDIIETTDASRIDDEKEIEDAFSIVRDSIDTHQIEICKKYWGFDCVKTAEELFDYFKLIEDEYMADKTCDLRLENSKSLKRMTERSLG